MLGQNVFKRIFFGVTISLKFFTGFNYCLCFLQLLLNSPAVCQIIF